MKRSDYPGHDLPRKELHRRITAAYQLAGRLLIGCDDPEDVQSEMRIVLLDFLSDPTTADLDRIELAARGFYTKHRRNLPTTTNSTAGTDQAVIDKAVNLALDHVQPAATALEAAINEARPR